jgi:hypothetical protein
MATSIIKADNIKRFVLSTVLSTATAGQLVGIVDEQKRYVLIYFHVRASADIASNAVLFNIPSEYRPSQGVSGSAVTTLNSAVAIVGSVNVATNGNVTVERTSTTQRGVFGVVSYTY